MLGFKFSLRDKFLVSFLGLAIVLTGMLLMLAQHVYNLLPSISQSQTQRYEAQLALRDIREAIIETQVPTDILEIAEREKPMRDSLMRYQTSLSLGSSHETYQALVVEDKAQLIRREDELISKINDSVHALDLMRTEGNSFGAAALLEEIITATEDLEFVNRQASEVLIQSQKTTQRFVVTFFLLSIAILLLGISVFAQLLAVWITHPLRKIQIAAMKIANGDFSHELKADSKDELGALTESFDYMRQKVLKSLEEVYAFAKRDETLIDSIIDSIIAVDHEGKIILFNAAAEAATGWSRLGAIHRSLDHVVSFSDQETQIEPLSMVRAVAETGKARSFLHPISMTGTKKQQVTPVTMSIAPFVEEGGAHGAVMVLKDVSELHELDRIREEFVSIASHQLRTPLTAIRWLLETLVKAIEDKKLQMEVKQQATLEQAYARTLSMSELVSSLLALSRIDAQKVKASLAPVDLQALCQKLQISFQIEAQRRQIAFGFMCNIENPIMSDEILLTEIVTNLVSNAMKYTKPGGKVSLEIMEKDSNLQAVISDNGIGIPDDQHKSMFKKFFRAKNALSFTPEGTGIGLYMVKSFLDLLGGAINFESKENVGSRFTVSVPLQFA